MGCKNHRMLPLAGRGIDNAELLFELRLSAPNEGLSISRRRLGRHNTILSQRRFLHRLDDRSGGFATAGHEQGGLCQTISRIEGLVTEATGGKCLGKPIQRLRANGFSPAQGEAPTAEV